MKFENKTKRDVMVPIKPVGNTLYKPVSHDTVKVGESHDFSEENIKAARDMGLTKVKAESSSIGSTKVETKQVEGKVDEIKKYSRKEAYKLNKEQQVLVLVAGYNVKKIPRYEKGRVDLILELQEK